MKNRTAKSFLGGAVAAALLILTLAAAVCTAAEPLVPKAKDKGIAVNFSKILEARHFSRRVIDNDISREAFDLYIKDIDPRKIYFTQADIDAFATAYRDDFALQINKG